MSSKSPIIFFIFNRPEHLARTLNAAMAAKGFEGRRVFIFGDGPRNKDDLESVEAARKIAVDILGDGAEYRFSLSNRGLSGSVIQGVTEVTEQFGRSIVLEDDLEVANGFFEYMDEGLERYADEEQVYQISGHAFDVPLFAERTEAMFLPFTTTWGWGTWQRAWRKFDPLALGWERLWSDSKERKRFNLGGVYDYYAMLERQMAGRRDSWGIRWYWSVFSNGGLTCFPPRSLVRNIGMDGRGTHGKGALRGFSKPGVMMDVPVLLHQDVFAKSEEYSAVAQAIWRQNGGWIGKAVDGIKRICRR